MVRLTDRPDMTIDVYRGRKTTTHNLSKVMQSEHVIHRITIGLSQKICLENLLENFANVNFAACF